MKATVVEIQSKAYRTGKKPNPYRLIALQFDVPFIYGGPAILRLPECDLGIVGICLDDVIDVEFGIQREESLPERTAEE